MYKNVLSPPAFDGESLVWVKRPRRRLGSRRFAPFEKPGPRFFKYSDSPSEMFTKMFENAEKYWRKNSNEKIRELTETWNSANPNKKPRKPCLISETDSKAFVAAFLHMGLTDKVSWKNYWSTDSNENDVFINNLKLYSDLSGRRFRYIMNSIRLYDKGQSSAKGWNNRNSDSFDEHFKVWEKVL